MRACDRDAIRCVAPCRSRQSDRRGGLALAVSLYIFNVYPPSVDRNGVEQNRKEVCCGVHPSLPSGLLVRRGCPNTGYRVTLRGGASGEQGVAGVVD